MFVVGLLVGLVIGLVMGLVVVCCASVMGKDEAYMQGFVEGMKEVEKNGEK